jgi:hypothetical protein
LLRQGIRRRGNQAAVSTLADTRQHSVIHHTCDPISVKTARIVNRVIYDCLRAAPKTIATWLDGSHSGHVEMKLGWSG